MRMLRLFRILSLIGSIVLVFACNTLNNRIQTNTLTCGDDYQGGDDFFIVEDPNGTKLSRDELEVIPLEEKNEKLRVSSRGCVEKPEIGKFIVRSKTNDWAKSIDFRISKGIQVLSLIDHGNSEVGIRCEDSTPVAVGRNELLGSFLFNRVESEFLQGFSIDYRILDPFMTIVGSGSVTLERAKVETPFADLPVGQNFSLFIKITNRLRGNSFGENRCLIFIDSTPPDIEIAVNGSIDFQKAAIWNIADVGLVEIGSRLSFLAKESDVKEIHYCATRLSDLTGKIESPNSSATCTRDNSNSTTDKTPIMSDVSSGIWRVDFFAVDAIGNRSTLRSRNFHFTSSNRTELIQSISYGEVSRAILEGQTIEAANYALRGSSMYRQLETKIEKFRVERNVTLGLTNVLNLTTLTLPLKGHREPISSMTISADGRNAFSVSLDKTVKTWDLSSGKLLRDFRLPVGDTVPSLTVDRGNQKVSVGYSYKGVEIYKSDNFSLEWDKFLEGEGSKFTVIDPSGTYLVTGDSAGVVRTRDLKNLSVMAEFGNLNSAVQNIIFSPDGNRIFVQTAASLVDEWDFVAGKRIAEYSKDKAATTLIGLSRSGKTLVLAKKDGPSEVWSTETKELLRSGDWTEIKSVLMADDDSTFLALDSQGNVDFHFLRQNGKPQKARYFSDSQQSHRMLMSADSSQILNAHYQADNLSVSFLTQDPVSLADKCKIEVGSELSFNRVEFSQNGEELEIPRDGGFEGCDLSRSKLNQILNPPYSSEGSISQVLTWSCEIFA